MIENLLSIVVSHHPSSDTKLIQRAYEFGRTAHGDAKRLTGEPFITHPISVAEILAEIGMDGKTIAAALLHDVIEDCDVDVATLQKAFGDEIAQIVEGVTSLIRIEFSTREEEQAENLRRLFIAMSQDIRVIIIKLADRLHNLRTLEPFDEEKQKEKARETLYIFAPLAHRLGIWHLKWELEDLSLRYLEPDTYWDLVRKVKKTREQRLHEVDQTIAFLKQRLAEEGIEADVQGRPKHLYSIYMKMLRDEVDFDRIYDLTAVRVICEDVLCCYHALGIIHSIWIPIQGIYSDHIARPKANGYKSIHTKVYGPNREPMEVQIRTWQMHAEAQFGIAAHWRYKDQTGSDHHAYLEKFQRWVEHFLELQREHPNPYEYLKSLEIDLYTEQVFVFTPTGDVLELPCGSTPVDFAYRIHSEIGHHCVGAKVNGRIVPLNYQLNNGDIVEIMTQKTARGPSPGWLDFVRTPQARSRIRSFLRKASFEENLRRGRERLERVAHAIHLDPREVLRNSVLEQVSHGTNFKGAENLIAAVGFGDVSPQSVIDKCRELVYGPRTQKPPAAAARRKRAHEQQGQLPFSLDSSDIDNILYHQARCCCPCPGDKVVGYITRGRGIAVHREDCRNISYYSQTDPDRIVEVKWTLAPKAEYQVRIHVEALDRVGLLNDITAVISEKNMNIESANVRTNKDHIARIKFLLKTQELEKLDALMKEIKDLADVMDVHRVSA